MVAETAMESTVVARLEEITQLERAKCVRAFRFFCNGNADEAAAMLLSVVGVAESVSADVRPDTDLQNMVAEEQPTQALERQRDIFEAVMSNDPFAGSDVGDLEDFTGEGESSPKRPCHDK